MGLPGIIIPKGVTSTATSATVAAECLNATSAVARCSKTFGGACGAATEVSTYPGGRIVVDVTGLEPRTRYDLVVSASNETSSTPETTISFSTRSAPKV